MTALFDEETILNAYLREASERAVRKAAKKAARKAKIKAEEMVRTAKKEARAQGREQGIEQGRREMTLNLYEMGMPMGKIAKTAKVSEETVKEWISETS